MWEKVSEKDAFQTAQRIHLVKVLTSFKLDLVHK